MNISEKKPSEYVDVIQQLATELPTMAPQQQKAAKYILENPEDVGLRSMRSIARDAGVKPATISRLCKSLGFVKYEYFRAPFVERLRKPESTYVDRLESVQRRGSDETIKLYQEVRDQDIFNIQNTLTDENYDIIYDAAETIRKSRRVYLLGLRGSYTVGFLFHYAYQLFRDNSQLVDTKAGMFADQLRGINSDDCMLVTSFEPYTKMTIDAVEYAVSEGVKIIAITDKFSAPIARSATHTIVASNDSPSIYQSLTSALTVNHALITLLVAKTGGDAVKIMQEAEKQLSSISAYW